MGSVMKFTCLLMLLCLSSVWPSNAQDPKNGNAPAEITTILKTQKEFMVTAATASTTDHNGIGGRKMALHKVMRLAKKVQAQSVGGSTNAKKVSTQVEERKFCRKKWGGQKMNCKQTTVGRFSAEIDETAGFLAFDADYHAPRHHPPKNN